MEKAYNICKEKGYPLPKAYQGTIAPQSLDTLYESMLTTAQATTTP